MHHRAAFAERKGQPVDCAGEPEGLEIDRACIGEDATYGDDFIAQ
jgi:hypothetical protein